MTITANNEQYSVIIKENNAGQSIVYIEHTTYGKKLLDEVSCMFTSNGRIRPRQLPCKSSNFRFFAKQAYQIQKDLKVAEQLESLI
jgi:hypothetical protein